MHHKHATLRTMLVALTAGLFLSGCSGFSLSSLPGFGTSSEPPPPPPTAGAMPSKYSPEEIVGRWGFAAYHKDADRARTENAARGQCRTPYVIAKGPTGGVMMHLADQRQPSELQLKGSADGKNFIGPDGEAGGPQDREIISFDGRVLITRYVDRDAATRYGNMIYVRCAPRG
jgi:hypothetical protein